MNLISTLKKSIFTAIALTGCLSGSVVAHAAAVDGTTKVTVWSMGEDGSRYYRIPAIATAADGSLVALADKRGSSNGDLPNIISVVCKRSTDGGLTWSDAVTVAQGNSATGATYGDPAIVLDRNTGKLIAVYAGDTGFFVSTPTARAGFYVSTSSDNGVTWTEPRSITDQVYQSDWYGAFCASGHLLQTSDGRIMFVSNTRLTAAQSVSDVYEFVCCSEDGGETWSVLNADSRIPAEGNGNESKVVETSNGDLIMSIRTKGLRRFSRSTDGGKTWSEATTVQGLVEPDCNGDIITYPSTDGQTRMLHSLPANASTRRDVSVFMSYDEGRTWSVKKKIIDGYAAYSSLTVLPDGSVGCLVEESPTTSDNGYQISFVKFTLDWLTDGADDPSNTDGVYDGTLNCDGTRYMRIPNADEFTIPAGKSMSISFDMYLDNWAANDQYFGWVCNNYRNSDYARSGFDLFTGSSSAQTLANNVVYNSGAANGYSATQGENIGGAYITAGYTLGNWAHVVWTYDGTTGTSTIYIDGVNRREKSQTSGIKEITSFGDILVGARWLLNNDPTNSVTNILEGKIDNLRFYSEALTADEVKADAEGAVSGKSLIAAYDFNSITGDQVPDITGNGHNGTLINFPAKAESCAITIAETSYGTVKVYNGDTELFSGRQVPSGTELTVEAIPDGGYVLESITVDGKAIDGNTFVANTSCEVSAIFVRDPSQAVEYTEPSGDGQSDSNCYVETASTSGAIKDINITRTGKNGTNWELCDDQTIEVAQGQEFTLRLQAKKTNSVTTVAPTPQDLRYCLAFVFTDWNGDGIFEMETPSVDSYSRYGGYGFFNSESSFAGNVKANFDEVLDITHSFTVPADAVIGASRIRVTYTEAWDSSISQMNGNYQSINKGYAYDYLVNTVSAEAAIGNVATDLTNGPVEYYNLQGMRVNGSQLTPGIYILRQGSKATKIYVK